MTCGPQSTTWNVTVSLPDNTHRGPSQPPSTSPGTYITNTALVSVLANASFKDMLPLQLNHKQQFSLITGHPTDASSLKHLTVLGISHPVARSFSPPLIVTANRFFMKPRTHFANSHVEFCGQDRSAHWCSISKGIKTFARGNAVCCLDWKQHYWLFQWGNNFNNEMNYLEGGLKVIYSKR